MAAVFGGITHLSLSEGIVAGKINDLKSLPFYRVSSDSHSNGCRLEHFGKAGTGRTLRHTAFFAKTTGVLDCRAFRRRAPSLLQRIGSRMLRLSEKNMLLPAPQRSVAENYRALPSTFSTGIAPFKATYRPHFTIYSSIPSPYEPLGKSTTTHILRVDPSKPGLLCSACQN